MQNSSFIYTSVREDTLKYSHFVNGQIKKVLISVLFFYMYNTLSGLPSEFIGSRLSNIPIVIEFRIKYPTQLQ